MEGRLAQQAWSNVNPAFRKTAVLSGLPVSPPDVSFGSFVGLLMGPLAAWVCCWLVGETENARNPEIVGGFLGLIGGASVRLRFRSKRRDQVSSDIGTAICASYAILPAILVLLAGSGACARALRKDFARGCLLLAQVGWQSVRFSIDSTKGSCGDATGMPKDRFVTTKNQHSNPMTRPTRLNRLIPTNCARRAWQLAVVCEDRFPYLATIDGDQPRIRPVSPVRTDGFTVYVANLRFYHKTVEIAANPRVELCYMDQGHNQVRITGLASVVTEQTACSRKSGTPIRSCGNTSARSTIPT